MKNYIKHPPIEPQTKKQQKEVDRYIKKLNIILPQEEFVLKCLLSQDWRREIIISHIDEIKFVNNMVNFKFTLTAPSMVVNYSCSNPYKEEGWREDIKSFRDRANAVMYTIESYCTK